MKTIWFAKQEKAFVCAVIFLIFMITLIPYWILLNGNLSGRRRRLQRIGDPILKTGIWGNYYIGTYRGEDDNCIASKILIKKQGFGNYDIEPVGK
jgi:hypothetical protein